MKMHYNVGIE